MRFRAPLDPGEFVVTCNRAHPAKLVRPALLLLLAVFVANFVQALSGEHPAWRVVAPLVIVSAVVYAMLRGYRWVVTGYALTSHRIVIFRSMRGKNPLAIPLEHTLGVVGPRGNLHRMTGHGTVRIALPGQAFELTYQKDPGRFVRICEEYRQRRFVGRPWPISGV